MSDSQVKIALVGTGRWGMQHARILAEREDVEFCAIAGRTPEKTRARAETFGVRHYTDVQVMLDRERPDLVSLCLPNKGHFDATLQVIRAGYPLFVEKPLVFELEQADILLAEAEKRGLFFGINFNHRYAQPVQMAREAIRQGRLGRIAFATWRFGGEGGDCPAHENLIETQCHGFDMLEFLCGPIDSVAAQMTDTEGMAFSTMALALHFESGAVGSLVGSYNSSYAYPGTHLVEINGLDGRVLIEDTVRRFSMQNKGSETREVWEAGYFNDADREFHRTFDKHFDAVIDAFRSGREPPVHARAGRRALKLALAAVRAFEEERTVRIHDEGQAGCRCIPQNRGAQVK
ncbi:MAG: Gfo/Idh/MocA family oxidoreductase [Lentisphaerae bacterium]|nr:Gfo/Idh/MocA family oxidoreductase [Lentisphaerota bacterium]